MIIDSIYVYYNDNWACTSCLNKPENLHGVSKKQLFQSIQKHG